ncbi:hypothetical protein DSO57_1001641 [Entomophthora muscae]|uniref:Uncharacterized protein n=2 Tax=Entomophthora muscae TaxID=34485 RepID=A0ACC2S042_9FUNG|nr:hypothetical protein DSO57_1001641 [Entomophthora muscae]
MLTDDFLEKLHSDLSIPPTGKILAESPTEENFENPLTRPPSESSRIQPSSSTRKASVGNSLKETSEDSSKADEAKRSSFPSAPAHSFLTSQGKRKNVEFHSLFPGLPLNEILVADYGCALQKGTLVQGRMYLTKASVSFHSSFFGWVNRISIPLTELVCIEKRHVAYVIPSAIQVATLHHKYVFTSFRNRDSVLIQLNTLWREAKAAAQQTAKASVELQNDGNESEESEYEQVDFQGQPPSEVQAVSFTPPPVEEKLPVLGKCACAEGEHLDTTVLEARFKSPLEDIYNLIYGEDSQWFLRFLNECVQDVTIEPWEGKSRKITYVKPLSNALGPRSTRCVVTQNIMNAELPSRATVLDSVESLDVPSGSSFRAKVRVCFIDEGEGVTRILVTGGSEWFKSSWIKGAIEKGISEGNSKYFCDLEKALATHLGKPSSCDTKELRDELAIAVLEEENIPFYSRLFASASALWSQNSPIADWTSYRLGLVFLAISLCVSNIINWNRASGLERHLRLLQDSQTPFDPPTLEEAFDDIVRFANSLHKSVAALDRHIELVVNKYGDATISSDLRESPKDNTHHLETDPSEQPPPPKQNE